MSVYLDYAAATPLDDEVFAAMQPYFSQVFHNPSALYGPAQDAARALDSARSDIAQELGVKASEIIFTAGGTEANNIAIHGIMKKYPDARIAISAIEHDSVRMPAQNYTYDILPVSADGIVDYSTISDETVLVSVMYANNEVGTVQPIRKIAAKIASINKTRTSGLPLYFHVDAAQAGNYLDMHVHRLGADLITINGGKLYGPKQVGALYVKSGLQLHPLIDGGGQERGIRSGTENLAGAVGLSVALKKSVGLRHQESERLKVLQNQFIAGLPTQVSINGSHKYRLPNNIHITIPGIDNERLLMQLDAKGIYAAAGSACSASHDEPSHVLQAMGMSDESIRSSVRFSLGRATTSKDIDYLVQTLNSLIA